MSVLIKGMEMPLHATRNGEKDTIYQCAVVVHKDNTAELVVRRESAYPFANCNEAHIDKYPLIEVQTPRGRLIDADAYQYSGDLIDEPTIIEEEKCESESMKYMKIGEAVLEGMQKGLSDADPEVN